MKIRIECVGGQTADEIKEFVRSADGYGVKAEYKEGHEAADWILEGKESAIKHVVAENWQVGPEFESYDELLESNDIDVTVLEPDQL